MNYISLPKRIILLTIHMQISGKVQGVFFRANACKVAEKYGLKGWIKNTNEGDVETVVVGEEDSVKKFIDWCKIGPPKARVMNVLVNNLPPAIFNEFSVF